MKRIVLIYFLNGVLFAIGYFLWTYSPPPISAETEFFLYWMIIPTTLFWPFFLIMVLLDFMVGASSSCIVPSSPLCFWSTFFMFGPTTVLGIYYLIKFEKNLKTSEEMSQDSIHTERTGITCDLSIN